MNKFRASYIAISVTVFVATVWAAILLNVRISEEAVPTLVNGITSSMSIIVGFCGAIIGIMFREIGTSPKSKKRLLIVLISLMAPIMFLYTTYSFLTMGLYLFAVRYSLSGLILTLYIFIMLMVFVAEEVSSQIGENENPEARKTYGTVERVSSDSKKDERLENQKQETRRPSDNTLIAEYNILNKAIWTRDQVGLVVNSIMISATLGIVTFAIQYRDTLGNNIIFNLPNAMFVPLVSAVLIAVSYLQWWTSTKLNSFCFDRIHEIENTLRIKGHHWVLEQAESRAWYVFRKYMWHFVFVVFMGAYLFTSFWLLRNSPTT